MITANIPYKGPVLRITQCKGNIKLTEYLYNIDISQPVIMLKASQPRHISLELGFIKTLP